MLPDSPHPSIIAHIASLVSLTHFNSVSHMSHEFSMALPNWSKDESNVIAVLLHVFAQCFIIPTDDARVAGEIYLGSLLYILLQWATTISRVEQ
jgi:hypothetical protein